MRKSREFYEAQAQIVKAMAHPTRLFIVDTLSQSELSVREITEKVGADMSTISKHLAILKGVGILEDRKQNNQVFYRLRLPCATGFFRCVQSILEAKTRSQVDMMKKK